MLFFRRFSRWGEVATLAGNSCHRLVGNVVLRKQNRCIADLCTVSFGSSATDCGSVHVAGARASFRKISGEYAVTASLPARLRRRAPSALRLFRQEFRTTLIRMGSMAARVAAISVLIAHRATGSNVASGSRIWPGAAPAERGFPTHNPEYSYSQLR